MHSWQNSYRAFRLLKSDSSSVVSIWPIHSATGWNNINRHNIDLDERNSIVKNGVTRTWMRWNFFLLFFSIFFTNHARKWRQTIWLVQTFDVIFGHESSIALEFFSPHFSELISVHPDRSYVDLFIFNKGFYLYFSNYWRWFGSTTKEGKG